MVAGDVSLGTQRYTYSVNSTVPASTFSGSTGGDGWDVFFDEDYVLNIFHHNSSHIALDCHLRSTGARCDGFSPTVNASPGVTGSRFPGYQSANRSGGWVNGNTGRAYAFTTQSASRTPGALCINLTVAPPESCGFVALSSQTNVGSYQYLSNAAVAGGRPVTTQTLTMRTAGGDAVPGWTNVPISVGQVLDMSDLPVATTGERPTFNVGFSLSSGTLTDADFQVLYEGPGPELCVDLTVDNSAADGSPTARSCSTCRLHSPRTSRVRRSRRPLTEASSSAAAPPSARRTSSRRGRPDPSPTTPSNGRARACCPSDRQRATADRRSGGTSTRSTVVRGASRRRPLTAMAATPSC